MPAAEIALPDSGCELAALGDERVLATGADRVGGRRLAAARPHAVAANSAADAPDWRWETLTVSAVAARRRAGARPRLSLAPGAFAPKVVLTSR
jgi:hypothetical protein